MFLVFAFLSGFGGGLGSMAIGYWGYDGAYLLAGGTSLVGAALALFLRHPGRPRRGSTTAAPPVRLQPAG